jgi:hypothetical protein
MDSSGFAYPDQQIDPRKKDFNWILQYSKASWADSQNYMPAAIMFNRSQNRFYEIMTYRRGQQSISKYKEVQPGDKPQDNTQLNDDHTVVAIARKFADIALAKLRQVEYNLEAQAVDPLAKSEEDLYFNQMKIKIMMRQMLQQQQSSLANAPLVKQQSGEPDDMEQLQMQMDFNYKHAMALNAEEGIQLAFEQNDFEQQRGVLEENLYCFGIGGFKVELNDKGMPKFRAMCGENIITSYCVKSDYSDAVHIGEIIQVPVVDLVPFFNKGQVEQICKNVAGKYGNPATFDIRQNRWWDKFTVMVLDLQFFSWNTTVYKSELDSKGNERFGKTSYANLRFVNQQAQPTKDVTDFEDYESEDNNNIDVDTHGGQAYPKYMSSCERVVYKAKWLIGTDLMYDYGIKENQTSSLSSWWNKKLDFIVSSWSFYKMQFNGIMEHLIPIADAYQLTWKKLQNLKNKLIPYLIELDLTALEKVGLGRGNETMTPADIVDFAFENFILLKRSTDAYRNNPNYKAMEINATGQLEAFAQLYADLDRNYLLMQQISGLNELTDGSTPNPKLLVPVADAAMQATNNALYLISNCEKRLVQKLGQLIVEKIQIAVGLGSVQGYAKALGGSTVKFFQINPNISLYELGIFIQDSLSSEEKGMLLNEINLESSQGLLNPADKLMVMKCKNITQAMIYLNYIIKKRKDEVQQNQLQNIQAQGQQNQQVAAISEQMKQQTIVLQGKIDAQIASINGQWTYLTENMKKSSDQEEAKIMGQAKIVSSQIAANAKQIANQI